MLLLINLLVGHLDLYIIFLLIEYFYILFFIEDLLYIFYNMNMYMEYNMQIEGYHFNIM